MSPVETVKAFYAAIGRGDVAAVTSLLHHDLTWTEAEGFPYYDGTWRSADEIIEKLLVPLRRDWDGFTVAAEEFLVDGDLVVTFGVYSATNKATGKAMRAPFAHRWSVRDSKIVRFDMYTDTLLVDRAMR